MKLRKTLAAILTGAMLFGLAACGSPSTPSPASSGSGSGSTPPATSTTPAPSGGEPEASGDAAENEETTGSASPEE